MAYLQKKRKQRVTLWFTICSNQVSLMFFIVNAYGQKETWCASNSMGYTQSDVTDGKGGWLCLFQSLWISFFAFAAFNWWFCQVVDLYLRVHLSKRNVDHYLKYYHAFSWGVPAICTIVLLASGTLGMPPLGHGAI